MRFPTPSLRAVPRTYLRTLSSSARRPPLLLTPAQLRDLPNAEKREVVVLDSSWHMPNSPRDANAEYQSGPRIPGARRLDLDKVADLDPKTNPLGLGHMLPTLETFRSAAGALGITPNTHVVLYDTVGLFSSPRGLFTFKAFGHDNVSVLDGGLPAWIDEGCEVEEGAPTPYEPTTYDGGKLNTSLIKSYSDVLANSKTQAAIVLDARSPGRFTGADPEPRPGLSSGHMPGARSLPFNALLRTLEDGHPFTSYKSVPELRAVLVDAVGGEDAWEALESGKAGELVFTCGSGMTAGVGWLATQIIAEAEGRKPPQAAVYDESWTGYASRKESPIEKDV